MKRRNLVAIALLLVLQAPALAATIEGVVRERGSDRPLAGAVVTVVGTGRSATTDHTGAFHLEGVPSGRRILKVEAPGFLSFVAKDLPFDDVRPIQVKVALKPGVVTADRQVVSGTRPSRIAQTETSRRTITAEEVTKVAGARNDPILAVTTTAGVNTGGFSGAPIVRGGGPNDNLYYLDNIEIGNPFHFGGLVSVFNANTLSKVDLYTGALPARYGNVMSAVIDVETRQPRTDGYHGVFDGNLLFSEGLFEGPLVGGSSFFVAGRRSYIDLLASRAFPAFTVFPRFTDFQAKVATPLPGGGHVEAESIGAQDALSMVLENGGVTRGFGSISADTGYRSTGANWRQPLGENAANRLTLNYQEPYTDFQLGRLVNVKDYRYQWTASDELAWHLNDQHELHSGLRYDTINFLSRRVQPDTSSLRNPNQSRQKPPTAEELDALPKLTTDTTGNEKVYGAYVEDAWKPIDPLTLSLGARYDKLQSTNEDHLAPRLGASWRPDPDTTLRLGYGQQFQYASPTQLLPGVGNPNLAAAFSRDYVAGIDRQLSDPLFGRLEVYHRDLFGLVISDPIQHYTNLGSGRSDGAELTLELADTAGWSGALALTYSRTFRSRPDKGELPYDYDQPWIANLTVQAPKLWEWSPSLRLRYATGRPYTPVVGRTQTPTGYEPINGPENSRRYPDGITWSARVERPAGMFGLDGRFYFEITQQREVLAVDYGENYEKIDDPTYNYGIPAIPYLGYQLRF
ncbi:MAG TPA: TonB-dependent receptor [Stenomitos sp.]